MKKYKRFWISIKIYGKVWILSWKVACFRKCVLRRQCFDFVINDPNRPASVYPYSQFLPKGEWQIGGSARAAWAENPRFYPYVGGAVCMTFQRALCKQYWALYVSLCIQRPWRWKTCEKIASPFLPKTQSLFTFSICLSP